MMRMYAKLSHVYIYTNGIVIDTCLYKNMYIFPIFHNKSRHRGIGSTLIKNRTFENMKKIEIRVINEDIIWFAFFDEEGLFLESVHLKAEPYKLNITWRPDKVWRL